MLDGVKRILSLPISTPGMGIFAETGILPAEDQIARKKIDVSTQNIERKPRETGAPGVHTRKEVQNHLNIEVKKGKVCDIQKFEKKNYLDEMRFQSAKLAIRYQGSTLRLAP